MEHSARLARWLRDGGTSLKVALTDQEISSFLVYLEELKRWSRTVNLTALHADQDIIVKHFLDSLVCRELIALPEDARLIDIGSGAGFPGLPLKIVCPPLQLTLLEPNQKKLAFLRHLVGLFELEHVTTSSERIETLRAQTGGAFSHAMTRALDPEEVLPFVGPILKPGGSLVLWRSRPLGGEVNLHGLTRAAELSYELPYGYGPRILSVLRNPG